MTKTTDEIEINGKKFVPYISSDKISEAVKEVALKINSDYAGKSPVFLVVLKGSIFFASDLLRHINLDCEIEAVSAKSYYDGMVSTGKVQISVLEENLRGKDLIIIEDIVDSGHTLSALTEKLKVMKPNSVETVAFLSKPDMRKIDVPVKYIGINIPPLFVVGYGLDYAGKGRQLPDIYIFNENN